MAYDKLRPDRIGTAWRTSGADSASRLVEAANGDALTASVPVLYDANGRVVSTATVLGNTTKFVTHDSGGYTAGNVPEYDANGNLTDSGSTPGGGGGGAGLFGWSSVTDPPTTGWTALNSASISSFGNSRIMEVPSSASNNIRAEVRTLSGDFTVDMGISRIVQSTSNFSGTGFILRESGTGKIVIYQVRSDGVLTGEQWNSFSSFGSSYTLDRGVLYGFNDPYGLVVEFGPTNRVVKFNMGNSTVTMHTVAKHDGSTTAFDQYGYFGNVANSSLIQVELFHCDIT